MQLNGKMIKAATIPAGKFEAGAIATADIGDLQVTSGKLAAAAVTAGKIGTGGISAAGQFAAGVVDASALAAAAVTAGKIGTGGISAAGQFAAGVVDASALAAGAVNNAALAANAVTPAKADLSVAWNFTAAPTFNADPTSANDLVRKSYADSVSVGLRDFKDSARVATAAALPANTRTGDVLTASANGSINVAGIDGIVDLALNQRVLVKNEVTGANNGLYYVSAVGSAGAPWTLTRTTDADASAEVTPGMYLYVEEGTANGQSAWVLSTTGTITLNTTALTFTQFSSLGQITAGAGLTKTGNTLDIGAGNGITVNVDSVEVIYGLIGELTGIEAGDAAAAGTTNKAARIDHQHAVATGICSDVGTANAVGTSTNLARADHVHKSFFPVSSNKGMAASLTTADFQVACATTIASTPGGDGHVQVFVNGILQTLGDGVKTKDCYFSADAGATARAIAAIAAADTLYWVGSVAGFQLAVTDVVDFCYEA